MRVPAASRPASTASCWSQPKVIADDRGFFVETYRSNEYSSSGIDVEFVQDNHSRSVRGTIRALHFQISPARRSWCASRAVRSTTSRSTCAATPPTYGQWEAFELSDDNARQLFVPVGFAHGFCVTSESADVTYKVSSYYDPETERGIAFDDPGHRRSRGRPTSRSCRIATARTHGSPRSRASCLGRRPRAQPPRLGGAQPLGIQGFPGTTCPGYAPPMPGRLGSGIDTERSSAPASPYPLPRRTPADGDSTPAGFLRAVPMFAGLSDSLRRQLAAQAEWVRVEAGQWLFRQGDAGDSLYVVRSGRLEVVVEQPGPVVVRTLTRGSVVGELALLTREPRSAAVRARRDSELLRVSSTDFAELLSHERRFSLALLRELGRQLRVSRGLESPDDPLPATIAIVPAAAGEPVAELGARLHAALAAHGSTALLDETAIADETAYGAGLDRAEREHERVLLSGCEGALGHVLPAPGRPGAADRGQPAAAARRIMARGL